MRRGKGGHGSAASRPDNPCNGGRTVTVIPSASNTHIRCHSNPQKKDLRTKTQALPRAQNPGNPPRSSCRDVNHEPGYSPRRSHCRHLRPEICVSAYSLEIFIVYYKEIDILQTVQAHYLTSRKHLGARLGKFAISHTSMASRPPAIQYPEQHRLKESHPDCFHQFSARAVQQPGPGCTDPEHFESIDDISHFPGWCHT